MESTKGNQIMKKIGLIDLFIDEFHANHYPEWFQASPSGKDFVIGGAWEEAPAAGRRALSEWCKDTGIPAYTSMEKLVEDCDCLCVLAPSNPETHVRLAEIPLKSGKDVFIDKPFAPDKKTAETLFAMADKSGSRLFSSSALRFGSDLAALRGTFAVDFMSVHGGGGNFPEYAIHQIEMIVSTMGTDAVSVTCEQSGVNTLHVNVLFGGGRRGTMTWNPRLPFGGIICGGEKSAVFRDSPDMFPNMLEAMLQFYADGPVPVKREETIAIAAILDASIRASQSLGVPVLV